MKFALTVLLTLTVAWAVLRAQSAADGFPVRADVTGGTIEGSYSTKTGIQTYLGVPFARPPVGDLRWRAPQPVKAWEGVRAATRFGPRPVQKFVFDDMRFRSAGVDEDCLYLNVWTPAKRNTTGLPVLVYFYGGGFVAGDGSELRYDGGHLAERGVVVVTVNYRLGLFGFLAHPELSEETGYNASGNWGLLDQAAAIKWVHDNVAAFGGDPEKITIAGESAGSFSVSMQMASPLSRDLLAGAVGQSGAAMAGGLSPAGTAEAEANGERFLAASGYGSIAELRQAPLRDLYELATGDGQFRFSPVLDGYFLTEPPAQTFAAGEQADVPLLLGWTSAEMAWVGNDVTVDAYKAEVAKRFPEQTAEVLALYPADDPVRSMVDLASDNWIVYGTWKWFDLHRKTSDQPVYRYRFDRVRPPLVGQAREREPIGAGHASDIEYFMGNLDLADEYAWTADDRTTSEGMLSYLANFVKTGNPNGEGLPDWPAAAAGDADPPVMLLNVENKLVKMDDARYYFLDKHQSGN